MNKQIYCGIDNGKKGALVTIQNNKIINKTIMPVIISNKSRNEYDIQAIIKYLKNYPSAIVIIEKAHAMPISGKVQLFDFGRGYGIILGIVATLKMSYHIVHSKTWQRQMFSDLNKMDTKQASAIIAQRLFPDIDFRATQRCKKMSDGLTDAALIAYFGSLNF